MRIAYVEDEKIQAEVMMDYFREYQEKTKYHLQVESYASADELMFKTDGQYPFDLMLLDIQMKGTSGMELAHQIRRTDKQVMIVFLTAVKEYVFEGYEVNAYRYLLKPIQKDKLFHLLDELASKIEKHYCLVYIDKTQVKIAIEDIIYIQSDGHYVHVITEDDDYMIKENFNSFIQQFMSYDFIQTHRSYVVNLAYVSRLEKDSCIMDNGTSVPVSRQQKKAVMAQFMDYFKGSFGND